MNPFAKLALVGLTIGLTVNLFAIVVLHRADADFFSDRWWTLWFPSYIVWLTFGIAGIARALGADRRSS